jgi:3-hydroxybutyryl-CoA dehydrogenase
MTTIAIIGAGPLGRWLGLAAARAGFRVFLEDVMPSNLHHAQEYLRQQLSAETLSDNQSRSGTAPQPIESHESLAEGPANQARRGTAPQLIESHLAESQRNQSRRGTASAVPFAPPFSGGALAPEVVSFVSTVEDAVREADLAIDCVPDELESKLEILWLLDRMAPPRTVIATPTTSLSIDDLASCTYRPEKCIAIAASPRTLSDERPGSTIRLISTPRTTPEAIALVRTFWERLGFHPHFELSSN